MGKLLSAVAALAVPFLKFPKAEIRNNLISHHVQEFIKLDDGCIAHMTDGILRATVPPEAFEEYAQAWPEIIGVVNYIRSGKKTLKSGIDSSNAVQFLGAVGGALQSAAAAAEKISGVPTTAIDRPPTKKAKKTPAKGKKPKLH